LHLYESVCLSVCLSVRDLRLKLRWLNVQKQINYRLRGVWPERATVVTHTHAKDQGQMSLGTKVRMQTNRQTDRRTEAIALPAVVTQSVGQVV